MSGDLTLPVTARPLYLAAVLVGALFLFDLVLVRLLKLGKIAWKRVDYIWLGVGALGLFGTATEVRRLVATNTLEARRTDQRNRYADLQERVRFLTSHAVCRSFNAGVLPQSSRDDLQQQYDEVCAFGRGLLASLPAEAPTALDYAALRRRPVIKDRILLEHLAALDTDLAAYIAAEHVVERTTVARERSLGEVGFAVSAPLLLAVALALRITKVTGEIRLERDGA